MASTAISSSAIAAVMGMKLLKGNFQTSSPNLPQSITIVGEANTANQSGLIANVPVQLINKVQAATLFGYGSPLHRMASILFDANVTIPVFALPVAAAGGAVAKVITVTPTGTATANGTILLKVCGREFVDGVSYPVAIVTGDTPTAISTKIQAALAAVLGCPFTVSGTTTAVCTAKWAGKTSDDGNVEIDLNGTNTGVTFAVTSTTSGAGSPDVTTALASLAGSWNTILINGLNWVTTVLGEFEQWNGIPDPTNPTGRYVPAGFRPAVVLTGTLLDDPTSLTDDATRTANCTIVACPAPLSQGFAFEAAANMAAAMANTWQNTPSADILQVTYPDMPGPADGAIPQMAQWAFRDVAVKKGCSTVDIVGGIYTVMDLVTTYHPNTENPPYYRYARDLNVLWNYFFGLRIQHQLYLFGKTLVADNAVVLLPNVIKPKMWAARVAAYNKDAESRALIVNADANNAKIVATISSSNPNRVDTTAPIQISGVVRIAATDIAWGFNFGTN